MQTRRLRVARWLTTALVSVVWGCGATPPPAPTAEPLATEPVATAEVAAPPAAPPAAEPVPAAPRSGIRVEARRVLTEQLEAFRRLDATIFAQAYDDDVFVFGPTADEVLLGREAARAAVDEEMRPLRKMKHLTVTAAETRLGAEGDALAWALDDVVVATGTGQSQQTLFRVASVLARGPDGVRIVGQAWSVTLPNDVTLPMASSQQFPAPKPMAQAVDPEAAPVQKLIEELLSGRSEPKLGTRRDTFFSGTAPEELAVGDPAIAKLLASFVDATRSGRVKNAMNGGLLARAHGIGVLAAYHIQVRVKKPAVDMPLRQFSLYLKEGDGYRPVLALSSFGFPDI